MVTKTRKSEEIRHAILKEIFDCSGVVNVKQLAAQEGVTVQSIYRQINWLVENEQISKEKSGKQNVYRLLPLKQKADLYATSNLQEDVVLKKHFLPLLDGVSDTVSHVFSYVFTEMLNNVIEHSEAKLVSICLEKNAYCISCQIFDNGIGIFEKISRSLNLPEKKFAILELAKGKFTTDPNSHTGEGVFFSSKVADRFCISSDNLLFLGAHNDDDREYIFDTPTEFASIGTVVDFDIVLDRVVSAADIMNKYTRAPESYGFSKTVVPVKLLEYQEQNPMFISRSQAKRLYARFEKFSNVILDFEDVPEIGQAFADELFRVFPNAHPNCWIEYVGANEKVEAMIRHVRNG